MTKSILYQLIRSMTKQDMRQFGRWIASPFFNRDQALVLFWNYLADCHWYLGVIPEAQKGFACAYPEEAFNDQKLRLLMSRLYKQLEQYLAYHELDTSPNLFQQHLVRAFRRRKLWRPFQRVLSRAGKELDKGEERNAAYYRNHLQLQEEAHHQQSINDPTDSEHLLKMADNMDCAYLIQRLRQSCLILAHSKVYKAGLPPDPLAGLLQYASEVGLIHKPAISLYFHCYQMLLRPESDEHFRAFKEILLKNGNCVSLNELRDLYLLAINYCIRQVNSSKPDYYNDLFALYRQGLEAGSLIENGVLSRFTYQNIVTAGIRIQEYQWVEHFIVDYQKTLERQFRESALNFCMARLEFSRRQYVQASRYLQKAYYRDPLLNLGSKTLQLKIYYEAGNMDLLASHLDAMNSYIRRKKIIGYHRSNYMNIIRYTRKLLSANPYDKSELRALQVEIQMEEKLTERLWLEEKVEALTGA